MAELLVRNWWALALRGAVAVLFGLVALLLPGLTLDGLVGLFAAYAFADGVLAVIGALRPPGTDRRSAPRREALLLEGIAGLALGLAVALWPGTTVLAFVLLVAAWALSTGGFALLAALRLRHVPGTWLLGVAGAASLVLGALLVVAPAIGILAVVSWIAVYALVSGGVLLLLALRLRARLGTLAAAVPAPREEMARVA